jgi:predicted ArsR family transcriptional regulator
MGGPPGRPPPGARLRLHFRGPGDGRFAEDLAKELDIGADKVKAALKELRSKHRDRFREHRDDFAKKLADKLGISEDKVKEALPPVFAAPVPPPGGPDR